MTSFMFTHSTGLSSGSRVLSLRRQPHSGGRTKERVKLIYYVTTTACFDTVSLGGVVINVYKEIKRR